ncbi:DNA adenine methylase [Nonomuraea sp. NPDC049504]|uniref:DNA adenine methylase n=1 Tax=Nonomuraea sp. NPDC049504 TaxID=3154729 RepID=UPI0034204C8E
MPIKHQAPFPYYGAKSRLAPWILSFVPDHITYVEPFVGSGAVLLAKPPSRTEVINDLNGDVVNFWRVLRDRHDELVARLQLTPYARDEYLFCRDSEHGHADEIERARRFFTRCALAYNASTTRVGFSTSGPRRRGKAATFVRRVDERLAAVAERLRGVEVENMDALDLIKRWRDPEAVLYLDPPYLNDARASKGNYATDNGAVAFHEHLIETLIDHPATVLLSGYAAAGSPYERLRWMRHETSVTAHVSNRTGARRVECLWVNRWPSSM